MNIEIKHRLTGNILVSGDYGSIKDCLEKNSYSNLRGSNLSGSKGYIHSHEVLAEAGFKEWLEYWNELKGDN